MAEPQTRLGSGFDAHRFGTSPPVLLCGIEVDQSRGVEATSDGDVAAHAVMDALLGAVAMGDVGDLYPGDDPEVHGADSMQLLAQVVGRIGDAGFGVGNVDVTVIAETVKVAPHRQAMRAALAETLGVDLDAVSVKATTTDRMGAIGRDEGIAAAATVLLVSLA